MKSLAVFGRLPALSLAELESLYGAERIRPLSGGALLDLETSEVSFRRLGGTIKLAKVLTVLPTARWQDLEDFLIQKVPEHLASVPAGSFTLGVSLYNFNLPLPALSRSLMTLKKVIKKTGRPVRIVPNKALQLNSAQVLHNKLTTRGAWELLLVRDGRQTIVAQTILVQDIEAYGARDQARPRRDARVGMLPPKLAQTMINIAAADKSNGVVLDPFCGTGVILQEALLMGYGAVGTDKDERMVKFSNENLMWLRQKYPNITADAVVEQADATSHHWPKIDIVASETYLGRPFGRFPDQEILRQVTGDVNTIIKKFLVNVAPQLKPGTRICLAVPAWRKPNGGFVHLPVIDRLTDMGYNYLDLAHAAHPDLIYFREGQVVARQLLALTKG